MVLLGAVLGETLWPRRKVLPNIGFRWAQNIPLAVLSHFVVFWLYASVGFAVSWWSTLPGAGLLGKLQLNLALEFLIALSCLELVSYWLHRLMHEVSWLWRLHTVHHSDTELDFSTTYRNHPLETIFVTLLSLPVIVLLGPSMIVIGIYQLTRLAINLLAHCNIYLPESVDRFLRLLIVTPDYHRVHHCPDPAYTNSNYGTVVPWFDYLFGTARTKPFSEQPTMSLGLEYFRAPADSRFMQLLWMPFKHTRLSVDQER